MTISIIVNMARNNAIGLGNQLLYHLPADMKRFKALTTGHAIVMGRKTFESFPKGALPNRRNIVLSHSQGLVLPGAEVFPSLPDALATCHDDEEVFIIGGASVYRQALPLADKLYLTVTDDTPADADAFFPTLDPDHWTVVSTERHPADDRHAVPFTFINCIRRSH